MGKGHELLFLSPDDGEAPKVAPAGAAVVIVVVVVAHVDFNPYEPNSATWEVWDTTIVHVDNDTHDMLYIVPFNFRISADAWRNTLE